MLKNFLFVFIKYIQEVTLALDYTLLTPFLC